MDYHAVFVIEFISMIGLRLYWHRRANTRADKAAIRAGMAREGAFAWLRFVVGLPGFALILVYLFSPTRLGWAELPLAPALRWTGGALFGVSLPALWWVHQALDRNFNTVLVIKADHTLVTSGPYRWVRHPMYTAFIPLFVGMFLLSANVLFALLGGVIYAFLILQRTPREEAQLLERFGGEYAAYRERTGLLLPRFSRR